MPSPGITKIRWVIKPLLHALLIYPTVSLIIGFFNQSLGVNPIETLTHATGEWGLRVLLVSLAITPLARMTHSGWFIQLRRLVGLYAFFYALLHFMTYMVFDLSFDFSYLLEDILDRPYITVGFAAFVILLSLTVTSPIRIRQSMAATRISWKQLHSMIYLCGILTVVHFLWVTRVDDLEPLVYGGILALLLGYRINHKLRKLYTDCPKA